MLESLKPSTFASRLYSSARTGSTRNLHALLTEALLIYALNIVHAGVKLRTEHDPPESWNGVILRRW